jgi:serine/threonine-protein kinase
VRRIALVVVLAFAGCAAEGTPLRDWTVDAEGGPHATPITLPGNLKSLLVASVVEYTLRTEVTLRSEQQGRTLSLVVDCFHGPLALSVDGTSIEGSGDASVGSWRFVIPSSRTAQPRLSLVLTAHRDPLAGVGFGVPPRLVDGSTGDARSRAIAGFNYYSALIAIFISLIVGVATGALFFIDRRRRVYGAMLINGITVTNVPLVFFGAYTAVFGLHGLHVAYLVSLANYASLIYVVHLMFGLEPVRRGWLVMFGVLALATLVALGSPGLTQVLTVSNAPLTFIVNGYVITRLVRLARGGALKGDARVMLVSYALNMLSIAQGAYWIVTGRSPFQGVHPLSAGIALSFTLGAVIVARQHAARHREIVRTSAELQHQVAERSRELGEALSTLAQQRAQPIDPGRVIDGRYRIIEKLGAGGMGTVYAVERFSDHKRFALKTLRGRGELDLLARFAREAQIAAEIDHPNLVPVLDVGITDGALFLVMPFVDGGTLEQQRARFGDVTWASPLLAQIAAGLAALHERGIVHRDLKPANVLLAGGVARIADFGLASLARPMQLADTVPGKALPASPGADDTKTGKLNRGGAEAPALTQLGDIFGTPPYMAPELESGVHAVKPASDVFAFGLIAYELLTGAKAFAEPPLLLRLSGKDIPPPDLGRVPAWVAGCLDLDPAKRPTAAELVTTCTA